MRLFIFAIFVPFRKFEYNFVHNQVYERLNAIITKAIASHIRHSMVPIIVFFVGQIYILSIYSKIKVQIGSCIILFKECWQSIMPCRQFYFIVMFRYYLVDYVVMEYTMEMML